MKFSLSAWIAMAAMLLPLLFLVRGCDCARAVGESGAQRIEAPSARCGTLPPLPRLPRG
jgi:hypothetical protein